MDCPDSLLIYLVIDFQESYYGPATFFGVFHNHDDDDYYYYSLLLLLKYRGTVTTDRDWRHKQD